MASSPDRRQRTTCEACGLPYYAEEGSCPYCAIAHPTDPSPDETGFVFDNGDDGDDGTDRTRCPECGLPHYADADGCPYCAFAGDTGDPAEAEPTPTERPTGDRATTDPPSGLFGRLKAALGL